MAALIRHGFLKRGQEIKTACENALLILQRNKSVYRKTKPGRYLKKKLPPKSITFDPTETSLAAKGFHRHQKPYTPPSNVEEQVKSIYLTVTDSSNVTKTFDSPITKFKFLNECFKQFQHGIPNSLLCKMVSFDDVLNFYKTPVIKTSPIDGMKEGMLPENLHIQTEYYRFHPETDTLFNGVSAFPGSSTIVTGIKYKKKYKGYEARDSWYHKQERK